ncbi:MAG: hypothetical protein GY757_53075 [bacterium]|nr:hypothetical protein [bacterium]
MLQIIIIIIVIAFPARGYGICDGEFINPAEDIQWDCMYPIKVAGISVTNSNYPDPPDCISQKTCTCKYGKFERRGTPYVWWKVRRLFEIVKDPYCFPSLGGISISSENMDSGVLGGTHEEIANQEETSFFAQAHFMHYDIMDMLGQEVDNMCWEDSETDVTWMTEFDPMWNDDELNFILNPEVKMVATVPLTLACIADAVAANTWMPIPLLHWCLGSWGSTFSLTGHVNNDEQISGAAAAAARMIFKMGREAGIQDVNIYHCWPITTLVAIKWHYRFQIVRPLSSSKCFQIGASSMVWGIGQNAPSQNMDNFVFMLFQKQCC